ncbi:MAG: NAD(P)-binding domain-containing protein [Bacteroidales bacterium]|nr:NAD(P)-binding domain-containing protein [Bacteroidales bacterium]
MKITVATEKPFAPAAVELIKEAAEDAGYEFELLEKYESKDDLIKAAKNTDALIIRSDKATKEVIEATDRLKIIIRAGAGYNNIDLDAAIKKGIVVMNTPGQNSNAVAELAAGMMVLMARGKYNGQSGTELSGKTLGIHAYGNVGKRVAKIAKGFGMNISAFDAFVKKEDIEKDGIKAYDSAEELYSNCQYISLHIPANEDTKESVDYELLSKMPKNATLVNTARKEVIHEDDMLKLMSERNDFSYISDIAPDKKDEFESKFESQVFFTPKKMGAQTVEANLNAAAASAKQIINFFENGDTTFQVNK